jgi:hypothetical protein
MGSHGYLRLGDSLVLDSDTKEVNPFHLALFQDADVQRTHSHDASSLPNAAIALQIASRARCTLGQVGS